VPIKQGEPSLPKQKIGRRTTYIRAIDRELTLAAFSAPECIQLLALVKKVLLSIPDTTRYRRGHSTMLIKLGGEFFLTDPVFSKRASPMQWAGPERFRAATIDIVDLPQIKAVILSYDYCDHLDHAAILALAKKTRLFLTPLGVGDRLIDWGGRQK
jgi:hypothetical protein